MRGVARRRWPGGIIDRGLTSSAMQIARYFTIFFAAKFGRCRLSYRRQKEAMTAPLPVSLAKLSISTASLQLSEVRHAPALPVLRLDITYAVNQQLGDIHPRTTARGLWPAPPAASISKPTSGVGQTKRAHKHETVRDVVRAREEQLHHTSDQSFHANANCAWPRCVF